MNCELCETIVTTSNSICPNCKFPIQGDVQEKCAFRMKLVDVRFWLENIEFTQEVILKFVAVFSILGLILLIFR